MNDIWIQVSQARAVYTGYQIRIINKKNEFGGELWLDRMGLLETSWLLFAGDDRYTHENFGYPGTYWNCPKLVEL